MDTDGMRTKKKIGQRKIVKLQRPTPKKNKKQMPHERYSSLDFHPVAKCICRKNIGVLPLKITVF